MPREVIESFSVTRLQIVDEDGNVGIPALEPQLDDDTLWTMYRAMVLSREADERMLKLQRQGRMGTFAPGIGQEAAVVGAALAMNDDDWFLGSFRELGGRLARGESLLNTLVYFGGYEEGNVQPEGAARRLLPIAVIVASQLPHAVGVAYAMKYTGESSAAVAFVGDGGTSEGDFHEALNLASLWQVPAVFICQNNQWAISVPRNKQTRSATLAQKAIAYDLPGVQVDGNDVLAVYEATREALERARAGEGPTFIEAVTYRLSMHTTADDPKKYRGQDEVDEWWKKEPIGRFRRYLENKGVWDEDRNAAIEAEVKAAIDEAIRQYEAPREFKPDAPFDHVFGTSHEVIEEQRRDYLSELALEGADHA